ncbi:MAG: tRNA dihydrouridine synthase DusB [Armatimonadota bacterium]
MHQPERTALSSSKPTAFRVGSVVVDPPILLAPMEDVTSAPFRRICKRIANPGLMFTEFVSSMAVRHNPRRALPKMRIYDDERPLGIQIFGGDPDAMGETARICQEMGADLVDINMGCWVPKVCRTGAGASLLKDPDLAVRIVRAVVRAVSVPVTVKVRAGWTWDLFAAPELAKRFEDEGVQMITLHARFAKQGFEGRADWRLIEQMREAVSVPLVGNGDVREPEDALRMFRETGCEGVMVGRAAVSNPWRLRRIIEGTMGLPVSPEPSIEERCKVALEHVRLMIAEQEQAQVRKFDPETLAVRRMRGLLPLYVKGVPGAAQIRHQLTRASTYAEVEATLATLLSSASERTPA